MIDITTTPIGHVFSYTELIDATEAVWGGIAWPGPEKPGCVVVLGAGTTRYADGYEISILAEYESFDVRELVKQSIAMDMIYWVTRPRVDQSGSPAGRWIGDETHDAAEKFATERRAEIDRVQRDRGNVSKPQPMRLTHTVLLEMEHLYDFLMPKIKGWRSEKNRLLHLKSGQVVASRLNEFGPEQHERQEQPKIGTSPAVEALGYTLVEMQGWLERRFHMRVYRGSSKADRGARDLLGIN